MVLTRLAAICALSVLFPRTGRAACVKDSDTCLQNTHPWSGYTCLSGASYCDTHSKDLQRCCPETCGSGRLSRAACLSLNGMGTCSYPNEAQCDCGSFSNETTCPIEYCSWNGNACEEPGQAVCVRDSDTCLQETNSWYSFGYYYATCASWAGSCNTWSRDMHRCCPETCGSGKLSLAACLSLGGYGTCTYPNDAQCDCKTFSIERTCPADYCSWNQTACGCLNTCVYAYNGICDDGGPNSVYDRCSLGTDCQDCDALARETAKRACVEDSDTCLQNTYSWSGFTCSSGASYCDTHNKDMQRCCPETCGSGRLSQAACLSLNGNGTCTYPNEAQCDCGSFNLEADCPSEYCSWNGTACEDNELCLNTCLTANDDVCDDGRPNSESFTCQLGTDCSDCGVVTLEKSNCSNTCEYANDGECDDGGLCSSYNACELGTDCGDCDVDCSQLPLQAACVDDDEGIYRDASMGLQFWGCDSVDLCRIEAVKETCQLSCGACHREMIRIGACFDQTSSRHSFQRQQAFTLLSYHGLSSCSEVNRCNHPVFGANISTYCPVTCGVCRRPGQNDCENTIVAEFWNSTRDNVTGVPLEIVGEWNTTECPPGSTMISESTTCHRAANALGVVYKGSSLDPNVPPACSILNESGILRARYNAHRSGNASRDYQPVCYATASPRSPSVWQSVGLYSVCISDDLASSNPNISDLVQNADEYFTIEHCKMACLMAPACFGVDFATKGGVDYYGHFKPSCRLSLRPLERAKFTEDYRQCHIVKCADGTIRSSTTPSRCSQSFCIPCEPGRFTTHELRASCTPCSPGQFTDEFSSTTCTLCPTGTSSSVIGATVCVNCAAGRFAARTGLTACVACNPGKYPDTSNFSTATICKPCPAGSFGKYSGSEGYTLCEPCAAGRYSSSAGASNCEYCGHDRLTLTWSRSLTKWLVSEGSARREDCGCAPGFRVSAKGNCGKCSIELECLGMENISIQSGFYSSSKEQEEPSVYRCRPPSVCRRAPLGSSMCTELRYGPLCTLCPTGYYKTIEGCNSCKVGHKAAFFLMVFCTLCVLVVVVLSARLQPLTYQAHSLNLFMALGQLFNICQILSAFNSCEVRWGSPFKRILATVALVGFDFDVVQMNCVSITGDLAVYLSRILAPVAIVILMCLVFGVAKARKQAYVTKEGLLNAIGQILTLLFISLTLAALTPFQCYLHPNGIRSVVKHPAVLCVANQEYIVMVTLACIAILLYSVGPLSMIFYANWRYPKVVVQDNIAFIRIFRFLFFRWRPECYWFSVIVVSRGFLIALIPMIVPVEKTNVTIVLLQVTLLLPLLSTVYFLPWRTKVLNGLECYLITFLVIVAILGATASSIEDEIDYNVSILLVAGVFACGFLLVVTALASAFGSYVKSKVFELFLSHHKGGGACAARMLKLMLSSRTRGQLFFDSDNLNSFEGIFDAVKSSKRLLIILSGETLCRPWCVGEIVTAHLCHIPMQTLTISNSPFATESLDKWQQLTEEDLTNLYGKFEVLRPHGIALQDINPAIAEALRLKPCHMDLRSQSAIDRAMESIMHGTALELREGTIKDVEFATVFIMTDHADVEATAAARTLKFLLQPRLQQELALDIQVTVESLKKHLESIDFAKVSLWLVTSYTLRSVQQLARLVVVVMPDERRTVLPVIIGDSWTFPSEDFYARLARNEAEELGSDPVQSLSVVARMHLEPREVGVVLKGLFSRIATFVNVAYSDEKTLLVGVGKLLDLTNNDLRRSLKNLRSSMTPGDILKDEGSATLTNDIYGKSEQEVTVTRPVFIENRGNWPQHSLRTKHDGPDDEPSPVLDKDDGSTMSI